MFESLYCKMKNICAQNNYATKVDEFGLARMLLCDMDIDHQRYNIFTKNERWVWYSINVVEPA